MLWQGLDKEFIFLDLKAHCSDEVMNVLGGKLIDAGYCKPDYVEALKKREKEFPTGIDTGSIGIAIPHTPVDHVKKGKIAIARLEEIIPFHQMGNEEESVDVRLVFMLAVDDPEQHLEKLHSIVDVIQDKTILKRLLEARTEEEIIAVIKEKEKV